MIMIIALLIILIILLGYLNWQFFKTFTEPRLKHDKMEMENILKMYEDIINKKENITKEGKTRPCDGLGQLPGYKAPAIL